MLFPQYGQGILEPIFKFGSTIDPPQVLQVVFKYSPISILKISMFMCVDFTHISSVFRIKSQACGNRTPMKKTTRFEKRNVVGRRVRQARLKANPPISQDDLAGRLAGQGILVDRTAISRIEGQARYVMDYEAVGIARALKVSIAWLFGQGD